MPADAKTPDRFSLRRWSRRKLEAARQTVPPDEVPPPAPIHAGSGSAPVVPTRAVSGPATEPALPPVESLTIDSDFSAYLQPEVDESLKRRALKKLFADPRFNVMDGLDVYIDDYTKSDPIPPDVLERLMKMHFEFKPPSEPAELPHRSTADTSNEAAPESAIDAAPEALPAPDDAASPFALPTASRILEAAEIPPGIPDEPDPNASR